MPIDLTSLPEPLIRAAQTFNLIPFIGAGISRQAITKDSMKLPNWEDFIRELKDRARDEHKLPPEDEEEIDELIKNGKFLMASQALKEKIHDVILENYFETRFQPKDIQPGPIHRALFKLRPPIIMTTNYDCLLEHAYAKEYQAQVTPATPKMAHRVQQTLKGYRPGEDRPLIFKIHGTASEPKEIVFAEQDYRKLIYGEVGYRAVISAVFVTKVVLMLGFSSSDPEISMVLQTLREAFRQRSSPDYIVLREGVKKSIEKTRLSKDFGLEVIEYQTSGPDQGAKELLELVEHLAKFVPRKSKSKISGRLPRSPVGLVGQAK